MPSAAFVVLPAPGRSVRRRSAAVLLALALMLPAAALAADAAAPAAKPTVPATLGAALRAVVDAGMARIASLETQAKAVFDDRQALEVQAQIIQAKAEMQRELLAVQLDFARRGGDAALVAELEGIMARLDAPAVAVHQEHPAPVATAGQGVAR